MTANGMEYPDYGEIYATLELPALGLTLDVTFGDDLKLIKNNVGQLPAAICLEKAVLFCTPATTPARFSGG